MDERRAALLEDIRTFWQARTPRRLTEEDARQAVENLTGFFTTLEEWAAAEVSRVRTTDRTEAA